MITSDKQVVTLMDVLATSVSKCWMAGILKVLYGVGKLELLQIIKFKNAS